VILNKFYSTCDVPFRHSLYFAIVDFDIDRSDVAVNRIRIADRCLGCIRQHLNY